MPIYMEDREWSDKYLPQVYQFLAPLISEPASVLMDNTRATDVITIHRNIAVRLRREGFSEKYANEVTIRCHRDTGAKTELSKIVDGFGDWFFYGHIKNDIIWRWYILSLPAFRAHLIRNPKLLRSGKKDNGDGTSFAWFDLASFPPEPPILVASSHPLFELRVVND